MRLLDEAIDEYQKALRLSPNFADIITRLGIAYRDKGSYDEAIKEFNRAKECNPKYIPARLHLGITYYSQGFYGLAEEEWREALVFDPDNNAMTDILEFCKAPESLSGASPLDLLDIQGLTTHFFTRAGRDQGRRQPEPQAPEGPGARPGRRIGVRQDRDRTLHPEPRSLSRQDRFRKDLLRRRGPARLLSDEEMRTIRGARISMIFQEPMTALNPVFTVGNQIAEVLTTHRHASKKQAMAAAVDLLHSVGIPSPEKRVNEYPHQLSGGMRQRVMIAMAIACKPSLILADEPTTALDVTIQAHILELLSTIQAEMGMAMVLVTHDLGLIAERAHEVAVMYAGRIVEQAETGELFANPQHPYTRGLMASIPKPGEEGRKRLRTIAGTVPQLHDLPKGCTFSPRCDIRTGKCEAEPGTRGSEARTSGAVLGSEVNHGMRNAE